MEPSKPLLRILVEQTFEKHGISKRKLTPEQKEKLQNIVTDLEQQVHNFTDKAKEKHLLSPMKTTHESEKTVVYQNKKKKKKKK
ncbi:hypothetical protein [Alteribacter aurantiacus]|uniref:hypothetical protein n=1 Tax=Alteribacter aurantiacus TaxID=254410 RepID=UPI0003F4D2CD|nr:hypothetical protein [Alteribacter aurantiacus]